MLDAVRLGVPTIPPMTRQPLTAWLPQYVVVENLRRYGYGSRRKLR